MQLLAVLAIATGAAAWVIGNPNGHHPGEPKPKSVLKEFTNLVAFGDRLVVN